MADQPAGWYPDPRGEAAQRYWDGTAWTDHVDGTPAGVSLHRIDEGIDTGPILARREVPVEPIDTGETLYRKLEDAGLEFGGHAFIAPDESFVPEMISSLKLRGAVGMAGLAPGAFDQFRTFTPTIVLEGQNGVTPSNPGNADLEPEKTTEIEGGFDMGLFNDRISIEVTGYYAKTRDAMAGRSTKIEKTTGTSNSVR